MTSTHEDRYAILIGINDYDSAPLSFCVNDGTNLKNSLIQSAGFLEKNVHTIFSSKEHPTRDITGALFRVVNEISETFNKNEDSIFFYFAGHGSFDDGKSNLVFHDSNHPIRDVFEHLERLSPKMQFYVIDACGSGGKTLSRGAAQETELISEYVSASSGIMFLYACQDNEEAFEYQGVKHGIMTYYFIKALQENSLYDEGILTPGRIVEYVAKKVTSHTDFIQNPVMESRLTGYYPFAFAENYHSDNLPLLGLGDGDGDVRSDEEPQVLYDPESRISLQNKAKEKIESIIKTGVEKYNVSHTIEIFSTINDLPANNVDTLISNIVSGATGKYASIGNTVYTKKVPVYAASSVMNHILGALGEAEPKSYDHKPTIVVPHKYLATINYCVMSNTIDEVSFGLGAVVYQAKWGLVISAYTYLIDWDGEQDSQITDVLRQNYSLLISEESFSKVSSMDFSPLDKIDEKYMNWCQHRKEELDDFGR